MPLTREKRYNTGMEQRKPDIIFSTLTGIVMVIFMLASLTNQKLFSYDLELSSFSISLEIGSMELLIPLAAVIVDLGMYRVLRTYLPVSGEQIGLHLFLPFAVTLTIGFTLRGIRSGLTGWGLLFITGALLFLVLRFEFIACDPASASRPVSIIVLDSLCYAIFLLFITALRANISRLVIVLPVMFILCTVVSLKIYSFHIINGNIPLLAAMTGITVIFSGTGLHYWPVNIISYSSLMFFWYYTFTNFITGIDRNEPFRSVIKRILPACLIAGCTLVYALAKL